MASEKHITVKSSSCLQSSLFLRPARCPYMSSYIATSYIVFRWSLNGSVLPACMGKQTADWKSLMHGLLVYECMLHGRQ